uniref:UPAR/Ly6 domain-containing protein n=2 Tax=Rousettus aegyptiacus TaxID=9407 RepID=A0A7J8FJJ2_ROUAE|nr:hypothetical protein HJG63_012163 [Rousettus aegyptiacus]
MPLGASSCLLLACTLAIVPFLAVSWEIKMNDLEEKDVDEFNSSGTCFAVMGGKCDRKLKWCAVDKMKCIESYGIINTGLKDIAVEMKKCVQADLCKETVTYMGFPIANESKHCRSAIRNEAWSTTPAPFFIVFL